MKIDLKINHHGLNFGGFRLIPKEIEFWSDGKFRLHDRFRFVQVKMNGNQIDSTLNFVFYRHKLIYNDVFIINFELKYLLKL